MTLYELQEAVKRRMKEIAEGAAFHDLQVYIRNPPVLKYEGDADKYFPRCVVGLETGVDEIESSSVEVTLTFGTLDKQPELKGYQEICHLIEITRLSLAERPQIEGFEIQKPIHFTLGSLERETYPYFFGAVWFDVLIPSPQRGYNDLV